MMTLDFAHKALTQAPSQAHLIWAGNGSPASLVLSGVSTDTRTLEAGELFIALRGERFDAHDHLPDAAQRGAAALLLNAATPQRDAVPQLPRLLVADTRLAYGELALAWRKGFDLPLAAVVGSNGKTTVTQMTGAILRAWLGSDQALVTEGNSNNDVGVPRMLLRLSATHRAAVLELGTNHPGEINHLARITQPTVALITNAQREHQEFLHGVEGSADENGAVIDHLGSNARTADLLLPLADACLGRWMDRARDHQRVYSFCLQPTHSESASTSNHERIAKIMQHWPAEQCFSASARHASEGQVLTLHTPHGEIEITLHMGGRHHAHNALAAAALASVMGAPLEALAHGLESFKPVAGRGVETLVRLTDERQLRLIDDTYNANPDSVRAAIRLLTDYPGDSLLILGDMAELGENAAQYHAEMGEYAESLGVSEVWTMGELSERAGQSFGGVTHHARDVTQLPLAREALAAFDTVLVKGSRRMRMERVCQAIRALGQTGASTC